MALSDSTSIVRIPDMSRWLKYNFDNIHRASARLAEEWAREPPLRPLGIATRRDSARD